MRFHFIVNPAASKARLRDLRGALKEEFAGFDHEITGSAPRLDPRESRCGRSGLIVVAAGGDGTVHRALRALAGTGIPLGVLPLGGANDFARGLSIPEDFRGACEVLRSGRPEELDLIQINGTPMATGGGLGLAAAVSRRADCWKRGRLSKVAKLLGAWVYLLAALVQILRGWEPFEAVVSESGVVGSRRPYTAILVAHQSSIGRWFRISASRTPPEGAFHICEIGATSSRLRMLWICASLLLGFSASCPEIRLYDATSLTIRAGASLPFFADGEFLGPGRLFELTLRPRAVRVIVPDRSRIGELPHAA